MTELERFLAVVNFEKPDYWPLIAAHALSYPHKGGLLKLHREGLPEWVSDHDTWCRYWGQFTFEHVPSGCVAPPPVKTVSWIEGEFEFVRSETGAVTRQVIDNDITYSMPDFIEFDVRDRASWEKFRDLRTPRGKADLEAHAARLDGRTRPAAVGGGSTWGNVRQWMGPRRALLAVYDEPDLVEEMIAWQDWLFMEYTVPVMQRFRPEVMLWWEDFCYNHGMMISPEMFRRFCAPRYRRAAAIARDCGAVLLCPDCDGKVDQYVLLLEEAGFNGCWPLEQVCGNDILAYRRHQGRFIFVGGVEKEIVNTGSAARIRPEIMPKVPEMLRQGGYFPAFDHGLSTQVGFAELCQAMTLLHEVCGSGHLGQFPRAGG